MWILTGILFLAIASVTNVQAQNACSAAAIAACSPYTCVQTGTVYSCLCPNMQLAQTAAGCAAIVTTQSPIVIPNICINVQCPVGATCVATSQNPAQYVCICPGNVIANPTCNAVGNNQCVLYNPCLNGGTCVVSQVTNQVICLCPPGVYGPNCGTSCLARCDYSWCYNGGRCVNTYGQPYCACPTNYRGRRCELRYNPYNYVYLYHSPYYYGKK